MLNDPHCSTGAIAFMKSISIEAVGLGIHLAAGAHDILLQTENILTSVPAHRPLSKIKRNKVSIRSDQPENAQEGVQQVCSFSDSGIMRFINDKWVDLYKVKSTIIYTLMPY